MNNISRRIKQTRKLDEQRKEAFKKKHDEIRKRFEKQLNSNYAWEKRLGIAYKNSQKRLPKVQTRRKSISPLPSTAPLSKKSSNKVTSLKYIAPC